MASELEITRLLKEVSRGDSSAGKRLYEEIYPQLRAIAKSHRRRWRGNETLNTTALIHEAFVKLTVNQTPDWAGRSHFFATASRAMRQILVNYAEKQQAAKRGGLEVASTLDEDQAGEASTTAELLALNQAMTRLSQANPRACQVAECRIFAGLNNDEIAAALNVSLATVKRDWAVASARLHKEIVGGTDAS